MIQENITINNMNIPIIKEGDKTYLPVNRLFEKCLGTRVSNKQLINNKNICEYIKKFKVDYGYDTGGIQEVYCICEEGLRIYFKSCFKVGRYDTEHRKNINKLLEYLHMDLLPIDEQFVEAYDYKGKYNIFIEDCIERTLTINKNIKWQRCSKCGNYYPYNQNFFNENQHSSAEINTVCRICIGGHMHLDMDKSKGDTKGTDLNRVYGKYGVEGYMNYRNINQSNDKETVMSQDVDMNIIGIYQLWKNNGYHGKMPMILKTKDNLLQIIKYYYTNGNIDIKQLNKSYLEIYYNLIIPKEINVIEIYEYLLGIDCKYYPYKYINKPIGKLTFEECKIVFDNYIKEYNIIINDVLAYNGYADILHKSRLRHVVADELTFLVKYYDYQYAGYQFKFKSVNYYKNKDNRIFDLKYYIEQDKKIPLEKTPLYLTKMALQRNARTLYNVLYKGRDYKSLYNWVNDCYPNKFIENDFVINPYREEFDSQEEMEVNDVLHNNFKNVTYNQINSGHTIKIKGMIPDWLIFTDTNCWIVEYFGLWKDSDTCTSKRNIEYVKKAKHKIIEYNKLDGYKKLYLYPKDLENNMKGVKDKLKDVI